MTIASTSSLPGPAASASAEPLMPEKITLARMLTWASPPRKRPTSMSAKPYMRSVRLAAFMISAARMKSGTARSTKLP